MKIFKPNCFIQKCQNAFADLITILSHSEEFFFNQKSGVSTAMTESNENGENCTNQDISVLNAMESR